MTASSQEPTSPSLLIRIRDAEDHAAWREFDTRYRELILSYCRRRGLQDSDAADVLQMVMLSLLRRLRAFRYDPERGRFRDYLGRCVRNAISNQFAKAAGELASLEADADQLPSQEPQADEVWEREWMLYHYRMALRLIRKSVDEKSVAVFEHLLDGESITQVAARYEMSEAAVHKVKQRMKARLAELISRQLEGDLAD